MLNIFPPPDDMKNFNKLERASISWRISLKKCSICKIKIEANDNVHLLSNGGGSTGQLRFLNLKEN